MITSDVLADKFAAIRTTLTERGLRLWASAEARSLGHGGIKMMAQITGLGRETVARGIRELAESDDAKPSLPPHVSRRQGGGRKKLTMSKTKETGLEISVCHFPPGTSKWNKIEHRMFSFISLNWRGRALATRQIIVNLIGETTTKTGLKIHAALDEGQYPTGRKVADKEMEALNLRRETFQPNWNYSLAPKSNI